MKPAEAKSMWLAIARLRKAEGDLEGAARAKRSAGIFADRSYSSKDGCVNWAKGAREKYLGEVAA